MEENTRSLFQPVTDLLGAPTCFVLLALGIIGVLAAVFLRQKDKGYKLETASTFVNQKREWVILVGPVGCGKTQLFYRLLSKVEPTTVSSTELNQTDRDIALEIPKRLQQNEQALNLSIVDIPGHFRHRLKVQQNLERAKAVILVVDSRDKDKISEAAEFLFDILSNNRLVQSRVPILVACNKQDLTMAKKAVQIEREFQTEFDAIRKVRRASSI